MRKSSETSIDAARVAVGEFDSGNSMIIWSAAKEAAFYRLQGEIARSVLRCQVEEMST